MRRYRALAGRRALASVLALGGAVACASMGSAEPLDKDACARRATESQSLSNMGVEQNMAKGPEWATANLSPSNLELIKRFITVNEQIKFRCRAAPVQAEAGETAHPKKKPAHAHKPSAAGAAQAARALPAKAAPGGAARGSSLDGASDSRTTGPQKGAHSANKPSSARRVETINATVN